MKKINKVLAGVLCLAVIGAGCAAFAGCANSNEEETATITITGSTSVQPLMQKLAAAYEEIHTNVEINVSGGGSGVGVTDAQSGLNDFGMASRELNDTETGVVSKKIADDGIAIIANTACTVTNVTAAEIKALYESGTPVQDTIRGAISREDGSGTRDAFHELLKISSLFSGTGFEEGYSSTTAVVSMIKNNAQANIVGYISMGSLTSEVKALNFEGVAATPANVSNGTYSLARPFNIVYKSEADLTDAAKAFIDWIMSSEGQAIVTSNGYISVA
ncbi:MAG: substrate-binding domain-containing protein [Candidatus Coproplasma sp.]